MVRRVCVECAAQGIGFDEVFNRVEDRPPPVGFRDGDGASTGVGHLTLRFHVGSSSTIEAGPAALGFAGSEELQTAFVEEGGSGVDPSEADRFFDGVRVGPSGPVGDGSPRAQPNAPGAVVVRFEPAAPLAASFSVIDLAVKLPGVAVVL